MSDNTAAPGSNGRERESGDSTINFGTASTETTLRSPLARSDDPSLVHVAAAVYDPSQSLIGRWSRLTDDQVTAIGIDPTRLKNDRSGFEAGIYKDDQRHALAFAGTDMTSFKDWTTNLAQGAGLQTEQYAEAVALAKDAAKAFDKAAVILTGHSLGGGLATAAAAATGLQAVVFNPAGVNNHTLKREGLDPEKIKVAADAGQIRNYIVAGEILNQVQTWLPIPKPIGQRTQLPEPAPLRPTLAWIPGARTIHGIGDHGMESVAAGMRQFEERHKAFFTEPALRASAGRLYEGELLSVPSGRTGDVTQQVGDQVVTHDRAKLATNARTLKAGNQVSIQYNEQGTVGAVSSQQDRKVVEALAAAVIDAKVKDPAQRAELKAAIEARLAERAKAGTIPSIPVYDKQAHAKGQQPDRDRPQGKNNTERTR